MTEPNTDYSPLPGTNTCSDVGGDDLQNVLGVGDDGHWRPLDIRALKRTANDPLFQTRMKIVRQPTPDSFFRSKACAAILSSGDGHGFGLGGDGCDDDDAHGFSVRDVEHGAFCPGVVFAILSTLRCDVQLYAPAIDCVGVGDIYDHLG